MMGAGNAQTYIRNSIRIFISDKSTTYLSENPKGAKAPFGEPSISKSDSKTDKWLGWWEGDWKKINRRGALFVHSVTPKSDGSYEARVSYWLGPKDGAGPHKRLKIDVPARITKNGKVLTISNNGLRFKHSGQKLTVSYKKDRGTFDKLP